MHTEPNAVTKSRPNPLHLSDLQRWPSGWTAFVAELGERVPLPWGPQSKRELVVAHQRAIGNIIADED